MFDNGLILFNNKDLIANSWDEIKRFIDGHTAELRESRELKVTFYIKKNNLFIIPILIIIFIIIFLFLF
jgi:hypothetical protein